MCELPVLYKEQIVQEFSETYLLVRNELLRMKKSFFPDYYIPEDEICYLCLYFQSFSKNTSISELASMTSGIVSILPLQGKDSLA